MSIILLLIASVMPLGCQKEAAKQPVGDAGKADVAVAQNNEAGDAKDEEAEIQETLAKLKPEDRKLAEAQRYCPVMNDSRLGSMGPPLRVMIQNQPVFLCCKGCQKKALADPAKTLTKVKELKEKAAKEAKKS